MTFAPEVTHVATFEGHEYQIVKAVPIYAGAALSDLFADIVPTILDTYGSSIVITKRAGTASPSTRDLTGVSTTSQTLDCSPPAVVRGLAPGEAILQVGDFETLVQGVSGSGVAAYQLFLRAAN